MASFGNFVFLFILKISLQCITLKILSFGRPFRCFIDWWLMIEVLHTMYHFRKENWNSVVRGLVLASFWHVPMQTGLWELLGCSRSVHTFVLLSVTTCISDDDDIHTKTMSKQRNNEKDFTGYLGSLEADQGERRRDRTSPHNSQHDLWGGVFSFIAIPSSPIQHQNFCNISDTHLYGVQYLNMCTTSKQFPPVPEEGAALRQSSAARQDGSALQWVINCIAVHKHVWFTGDGLGLKESNRNAPLDQLRYVYDEDSVIFKTLYL